MTRVKHLQEEDSYKIPALWLYQSINSIYKLFSASQISLNNCMPVEFELLCNNISMLLFQQEKIRLKFKLTYNMNDQSFSDVGDVEGFNVQS